MNLKFCYAEWGERSRPPQRPLNDFELSGLEIEECATPVQIVHTPFLVYFSLILTDTFLYAVSFQGADDNGFSITSWFFCSKQRLSVYHISFDCRFICPNIYSHNIVR